MRDPIALPGSIVDADWLAAELGAPDLVVVDVRVPEAYAAGHIPGAVSLSPQRLFDPNLSDNRNIAPLAIVEQELSQIGVAHEKRIVVYDNGVSYRAAARAFWVLELHGHRATAVLRGGFGAWEASGRPQSIEPTEPTAANFVAMVQPDRLATKLTIMRSMNQPDTVVLDSRSLEEYTGALSSASRKGHIQSAIHVDFRDKLSGRSGNACHIVDFESLSAVYREQLPKDARIVTYCNSGRRSAVSYLALRSLGIDVAVYDGGWYEWGNDPALPVESGAKGSRGSADE